MWISEHGILQSNIKGSSLLDIYPGGSAWFSTRRLRDAYTGNCIKVRRSSDNTEQDIGFTSSGNLDETALTTFVGANNGFVSTWYDQSLNGYNATQATTANQPRIVSSGTIDKINSRPTLFFTGNSHLTFNASTIVVSIFSVFRPTSLSGSTYYRSMRNIVLGKATGYDMGFGISNADKQLISTNGSDLVGDVLVVNTTYLQSAMWGSNAQTLFKNSNQTATRSLIALWESSVNPNVIGRVYSPSSPGQFFGYISELVIYSSNQILNRTAIETNINTYFTIY